MCSVLNQTSHWCAFLLLRSWILKVPERLLISKNKLYSVQYTYRLKTSERDSISTKWIFLLLTLMFSICLGMLFHVCWIILTSMSSISGQKTFLSKVGKGQDQKMFLIQTSKQVQTIELSCWVTHKVYFECWAYTVQVLPNLIMQLLELCVSVSLKYFVCYIFWVLEDIKQKIWILSIYELYSNNS